MVAEVLKSISVLSETLLQPDAILRTQLVQRLLECDAIGLTSHSSTVAIRRPGSPRVDGANAEPTTEPAAAPPERWPKWPTSKPASCTYDRSQGQ